MERNEDIFTGIFDDDMIGAKEYRTWEEIPVSSLKFNSSTSQVCYIKVKKSEAIDIINNKAVRRCTIAYEYAEHISTNEDDVILAIALDTSNMLDMFNKNEYISILANKNKSTQGKSLIRRIKFELTPMIAYEILDNRCVIDVVRPR